MRIYPEYEWKKITPDDGHYFFGYYDRNPWNCDGSRHLTLKAPQCERLPLPGETAEIGLLDGKGGYEPLTRTRVLVSPAGQHGTFPAAAAGLLHLQRFRPGGAKAGRPDFSDRQRRRRPV